MYNIKDLEKLSGVKAHTLRIWEKRYQVLTPHRTETNIRYYDDQQLIHLLNIKTLISNNWKISKVSKLSEEELRKEVEKVTSDYENPVYESQVNQLVRHSLAYREEGIEETLETAFTNLGVKKTVVEIIYPFLHKIGIMWRIGDLIPVQEHFVTNIIRRKLLMAIDQLKVKQLRQERFILFLPEDEYHEIGLLLCHYILRSKGCRVYYFGSNVPLNNIIEGGKTIKPDYLFFFLITPCSKEDMIKYLDEVSSRFSGKRVLVAGELVKSILPDLPDKVTFLASVEELERLLFYPDPS